MRTAQLTVGGVYGRWQGLGETPERLVLVELHGKGWITVQRDDGERERIRTDGLHGLFEEVQREYQERQAHVQHLQDIRLTWERFQAGEPCPTCGRPWKGTRPDLPGLALQVLATGRETSVLDPTATDERVRARMVEALVTAGCAERTPDGLAITDRGRRELADADEDEAFKAAHQSCRFHIFGGFHRGGRDRTHGPSHCGACCPPPPASPEVLDMLASMLVEAERQRQTQADAERAEANAERAEAANRARRAARIEQHVKALVDDAGELTEEQRKRLGTLLRPD